MESMVLRLPSAAPSTPIPGGTGVVEAYGKYLADSYPWQWFVTITSANTTHPEAMLKRLKLAVSMTERAFLGPRPRTQDRVVWVAGEERTKLGNPHLHVVMWQRHDLNTWSPTSRNDFRKLLNELSGFSKVEKPRSAEGVCGYCSKYLSKEGELQFSPTFGAHPQFGKVSGQS